MGRRSSESTTHRRNCAFKIVVIGPVGKSAGPDEYRKYNEATAELSVPNQTSKKIL
jgi:hypothetical protein